MKSHLNAPFPYFGGKSRVADIVWQRFGDVKNYVEPFVGSAAVLLRRPAEHFEKGRRIETINDFDGMVANFWRAITFRPEETADYADWPVVENDLHARHRWLVGQKQSLVKNLEADPEYCDPKIAGWWVWGMSIWIGGGFCKELSRQKLQLSTEQGIHRQRPNLGFEKGVKRIMPSIGRNKGIHRKKPHLDTGRGIMRHKTRLARDVGVHKEGRRLHLGRSYQIQSDVYDIFQDFLALSERLRRVRVVCGDWQRVTSPTATHYHNGVTGIFLDPPYLHAERDKGLYAEDQDVFEAVWDYAVKNGSNPKLRIAVCGLEDGRQVPDGWTVHRWKANGGYGRLGEGRGKDNAKREVIWFSPHCLTVNNPGLFE